MVEGDEKAVRRKAGTMRTTTRGEETQRHAGRTRVSMGAHECKHTGKFKRKEGREREKVCARCAIARGCGEAERENV